MTTKPTGTQRHKLNMEALTRDVARKAFWRNELDYGVVAPGPIRSLRGLVNSHMKQSGCIRGLLRCHQRPVFFKGGCAIRCRADYFSDREAVTFNPDGFIGFAGWASAENVAPILDAFHEWCGLDWSRFCGSV